MQVIFQDKKPVSQLATSPTRDEWTNSSHGQLVKQSTRHSQVVKTANLGLSSDTEQRKNVP